MFNEAFMFGDGFERCVTAVSIALPLCAVREPAKLMVLEINLNGMHTVAELRRAKIGAPELQT